MNEYEFEISEEFSVLSHKRFVIRLKGTKISFNVEANSAKEAIQKVRSLLENGFEI